MLPQLAKVNKTTAAYYFTRLKMLMAQRLALEREGKAVFDGKIKVDER